MQIELTFLSPNVAVAFVCFGNEQQLKIIK